MEYIINVSVVIATYNPDSIKLINTIKSVLIQENIIFEIIITDDGSNYFPLNALSFITEEHPNVRCNILRNDSNQGTVKNLLVGLQHSSGEYVVFISPGDMLFDENTLYSFYSYAVAKKADMCFGNAIHYCIANGEPHIFNDKSEPYYPQLYNSSNSLRKQVSAHFFGNRINGTTYFRRREVAYDLLNRICQHSKYVEDTTSLWLYLAENEKIYYFDRNFSWYERGYGISTCKEKKWKKILDNDYLSTLKYLKNIFKDNPVIDYSLHKRMCHNKIIKMLYGFLVHPYIAFVAITNQIAFNKRKTIDISEYKLKLERILKTESIINEVQK